MRLSILTVDSLLGARVPVFLVLACALTCGCSAKARAIPRAAARAPAADSAESALPSAAVTDNASNAGDLVERPAFKPPFPERRELFIPAEKPVDAPAAAQIDRPRVRLKGFANLDGRQKKALVSVDGVVTTVEVGQFRGDVQVISINPPRVTFQRGAHRWTESLFTPP